MCVAVKLAAGGDKDILWRHVHRRRYNHIACIYVVCVRDDSSAVALIAMVDARETSLRCVVAPSPCVAACLCSVYLDI